MVEDIVKIVTTVVLMVMVAIIIIAAISAIKIPTEEETEFQKKGEPKFQKEQDSENLKYIERLHFEECNLNLLKKFISQKNVNIKMLINLYESLTERECIYLVGVRTFISDSGKRINEAVFHIEETHEIRKQFVSQIVIKTDLNDSFMEVLKKTHS